MDTNSLNDRLISRPDGFLEKNVKERLTQLREGRTWQVDVFSLRGFSGKSPDFTTEQEADAWIASQKKLHGEKFSFTKYSYDYSGLTKEAIEEAGLPKGEFWRQQGKTPWGAKAKGSGKKKKPFKSAYSKLTPDQKKQFNSKMKLHYIKSTLRKEDVSEDEKYVNCAICGGHVKKGEKVCPNCGEKAPYFRENESVQEASFSNDVPIEKAAPYVKDAIAKCLGKVFHYTGGTRRYVCARVHIYDIREGTPDYIIGMDLVALSGSERGCNPTNDTVKDIGSKWLVDKDQTIVFKGKTANKLASLYKFKAIHALKPAMWDRTGIGSHMAFEVGAAFAGVAPASPTITQEVVYSRLERGNVVESFDTAAIRRIEDFKQVSFSSPEWNEILKVLHNDLKSGMLSKDVETRVKDVVGAADSKLSQGRDLDNVEEKQIADRLVLVLRKGEVQETGNQE